MLKDKDIEEIKTLRKKLEEFVFDILYGARVIAIKGEDQHNNFIALTASEVLHHQNIRAGIKENRSFIDKGMNTKEEMGKALEALAKVGEFDHKEKKCKITKMSWNGEIYYTCEFI